MSELLTEADRLTRQQVGRVRADLQARLGESTRELARALRERFTVTTDILEKALADAADDRDAATGNARGVAGRLEPRADQLRRLRARLTSSES